MHNCLGFTTDDSTLALNNALSSSSLMELCDHPSSQQQEPTTNSSGETSQLDELYTTRGGHAGCCPERLDL